MDRFKALASRYVEFRANPTTGINNLVYTGAGLLERIVITQNDAAPTAGIFSIYDSVSAYGTAASRIFTQNQTTAVFMPYAVELNVPFNNGLSIGFTTTNDVNVGLVIKTDA